MALPDLSGLLSGIRARWVARSARALVPLALALGLASIVAATAATAATAGTPGTAGAAATRHAPPARAAFTQQCADPFSAQRDPTNPLDLSTAPGANPLTGASLFVPGPAHGEAAGAIATMLGLNPKTLPGSESWAAFERDLTSGTLSAKLTANPTLAHDVKELSKIAAEPEAQRISAYSEGGTPAGIFGQTQKIFCSALSSDPGSIPIFNTYFLHAELHGCPTPAQVTADNGEFDGQIDAMAAATADRPSVWLLELDSIGSSQCIVKSGALPEWEADLRFEIGAMAALPHTLVYTEAGYSDGNSPAYTARILNAIGVSRIRGFFTNDTHENWTINEVKWANRVSALTHGAHYIVDTAENGRGPLLNSNRVKNGNEDLCNPPGRGLGPADTTKTGYRAADAFLWTHPPGNSSGCGGGPPGGVFWPARAIGEAQDANGQLGPGYPSMPY